MSQVSPTDDSGSLPYKPQYRVSPEFRKFWEKLFKGTELSDKEVQQMTDQFVKKVSDDMNHTLNWAIQQQKKRDQEEQKSEE